MGDCHVAIAPRNDVEGSGHEDMRGRVHDDVRGRVHDDVEGRGHEDVRERGHEDKETAIQISDCFSVWRYLSDAGTACHFFYFVSRR